MVRGTSKLVTLCRVLGRQRERFLVGNGGGRFSTVADVTDDGNKSSGNELPFGVSSLREENSLAPDKISFGAEASDVDVSSNSSVKIEVSRDENIPTPDKILFGAEVSEVAISSNSSPSSSVKVEVSLDGATPPGADYSKLFPAESSGTFFPASQFPVQPVRNERYFRSRNNSTVANLLKLLEMAASREEVRSILDGQTLPSRWPWLPLLDALQRGPKPYLALEVFYWKEEKFADGDPREYAKMISNAGKLNQLEIATSLFREMERKGVKRTSITCNALISAYSKNDLADKALEIFKQMQDGEDCKPTLVTYNTLISMYSKSSVSEMERIFELCKSSGFEPDRVTYNSMIWGYMKSAEFGKMEEMYKQLKESGCQPDPITFSGLIIGFSKTGEVEKMELAFSHMQEEGFPISSSIAETLTEFYASDKKFEKMERIIKITNNTPGAHCSSRLFSHAIQAYAESGRISDLDETIEKMFLSKRIFGSAKTLEAVITAYGSRFDFERLDRLLERLKPLGWAYHPSTYHALLFEYGKGRELEKMEAIFKEFQADSEVAPTEETYRILADSYRAAGDEEGLRRTIDTMGGAGFKTKEVIDTQTDSIWTDDEIFGGRRR